MERGQAIAAPRAPAGCMGCACHRRRARPRRWACAARQKQGGRGSRDQACGRRQHARLCGAHQRRAQALPAANQHQTTRIRSTSTTAHTKNGHPPTYLQQVVHQDAAVGVSQQVDRGAHTVQQPVDGQDHRQVCGRGWVAGRLGRLFRWRMGVGWGDGSRAVRSKGRRRAAGTSDACAQLRPITQPHLPHTGPG